MKIEIGDNLLMLILVAGYLGFGYWLLSAIVQAVRWAGGF